MSKSHSPEAEPLIDDLLDDLDLETLTMTEKPPPIAGDEP